MQEQTTKEFFARYERPLRCMFDFYCKVEHVALDEMDKSAMQYRAFVKLTNQLRLAPELIANEDVVIIYKLILKGRTDKSHTISYEELLSALVRAAIRGRRKLGGTVTKTSEEGEDTAGKSEKKPSNVLFFDVKEISVDTLDALMKYIDISSAEKTAALKRRLIELQHGSVVKPRQKAEKSVGPRSDGGDNIIQEKDAKEEAEGEEEEQEPEPE